MAGTYNLAIEQGATFKVIFQWTDSNNSPINITGYTLRSQIRATVESSSVMVDMTNANGKVTISDAAQGKIQMLLSATETASLAAGTGVWDLEVIAGDGTVTRLLQGSVTISPEVTR